MAQFAAAADGKEGEGKGAAAAAAADQDINLESSLITARNPRGIPQVVFIEDVTDFLNNLNEPEVETVIGAFSELHKKYKFMESSKMQQKLKFKLKTPELERTVDLVRQLMIKQHEGEDMVTHYSLSDNVYAKARVQCDGKVCLWLGANVMLEYGYEDALELLLNNLEAAKTKTREAVEDLDFLRSQIITTEVNMARVYNHSVRQKQQEKESAAVDGAGGSSASGTE